MATVLLGLGANLGDREANLARALVAVGDFVRLTGISGVYETAPMYRLDQPSFLNAAAIGETDLGPLPLLRRLKAVEGELGRQRRERNGPREVDLDLLAYGVLTYRTRLEGGVGELVIPHPRLAERRFVLAPLAEIAPDVVIPSYGRVADLLLRTQDQAASVLRVGDAPLPVPSH